ncbi:MAG: hypothetical protein ACOCZU_02825 [Planctomycetota bacterium]
MKRLTAALVLVMCVTAAGAATPPPLSDRLPGDTKAYLGWSGRTMAFEGSLLGQLLGEPSVEKLLAAIKKSAEKSLSDDAQEKLFKHGWSMALTAWQHPATIALTDLPVHKPQGRGPVPGVPGAVVLIDLGKDQPAFKKDLDGLIDAIDENVPVVETHVDELPCRTIRLGEELNLHFGFDKTTFFLTTRKDVLEAVQAVRAEESLASNKEFIGCMKDVGRENLQMALYADADWLMNWAVRLAPKSSDGPDVTKILASAGLDKVTALAAATSIVDRNMYTRARLFTPAPHTGLMRVLATDPLTDDDLAGIPADADFALAAKMPLDTLYSETHRFSSAVTSDPNAITGIEAMAKQATGLDVKGDIVDALGDTWVLCSAPSRGGFLTGTSLSVTLKDSRKAAATVGEIEAMIRKHARQAEQAGASPWSRPTIPRLHTRKIPRAEITTCTFEGNIGLSAISPSWTLYKDKLHVALWPQVVQSIVETNGSNTPLTADETFKAYRKRVTAKPIALTWVNTPSLLKQVYNVGMVGWSMGSAQLTQMTGVEFRPGWLPPLKTLQKYMPPSISAVSMDANGVLMEHFGPMPSTGMEMVNTQALAVSILLPSLHQARNRAKQAVSMTRLKGLGTAIALYQNEHNDTLPPTLDVLVREGFMGGDQVQSPFSNTPLEYSKDRGFSREPDYVMLQLGDTTGMPGNTILAYERPEFYNKRGTIVLQLNQSVQWMTMEEFQAAMKKTRAAINSK